jgi:molecular chaperone GrpE
MIFKKRKSMQEPKMNPTAEDQNTAGTEPTTEENMAHGLNTDDSIAGSGVPGGQEDVATSNDDALQAELAEAKDKYLRLAAEFENWKRRTAKERIDMLQTAGREVLQSMLPVMDDFERASKTIETAKDVAQVREGVNLVFSKLRNTLQQQGLKQMESQGKPFDPELHEAITEFPVAEESQKGLVMDVIEPGYYLNDKLIRHAKVVVGK